MEYIKKNDLINRLIFLFFIIGLFFILNSELVFAAGASDEENADGEKLPVGVEMVSRYDGGFKEIQNSFVNEYNQNESDVIRYYYAANIYEKAINDSLKNSDNKYTVYLYSLTNNKFDEEIADAMKERKKNIDSGNYSKLETIPGFFDGETMTYFPDGERAIIK